MLIDRVYEQVYLGRWDPSKTALTWDWVRIFMFSGLRGAGINRRYLDVLRTRIRLRKGKH